MSGAPSCTTARRWSACSCSASSSSWPSSPGRSRPYSPTAEIFLPAQGPSSAHWLGTTAYGQDIFSQLIWSTRESVLIALAVGGLATLLAVVIGVSAGYLGGLSDGVLSLITDVILVIPTFPLIIVIAAYEKNAGMVTLIVVLGLLGWSYGARQLRSQTLSLRNRDFLEAARVRGERKPYIIVAEILPTMTSLIVASFLGAAVYAVLFAAGLQFIGLGDPNSQSWGTMLYWAENNEALGAGMRLWAIAPGRLRGAARRGVRAAQLRLRRAQQPRPARSGGRAPQREALREPRPTRRRRPARSSRSATCRWPTPRSTAPWWPSTG